MPGDGACDGRLWYVSVTDGIHAGMCSQAHAKDTKLRLEIFFALAAPESKRL